MPSPSRIANQQPAAGRKRRKWSHSRQRKLWSLAETLALLQGIKTYGTRWQRIYDSRKEGAYLKGRLAVGWTSWTGRGSS